MEEELLEEMKYLPKKLYLRLTRRQSTRYFSMYYYVLHFMFIILGALLLNSVYMTRFYITNGDSFWEQYGYFLNGKELQVFSAFSGIFVLFIGVINLMNNGVILYHLYNGGLRKRLKFAQINMIVIQHLLFIFSFIPLIKFGGLSTLYPVLFVLSFFNLLNSLVFYLLIRRVVRREVAYMLSLKMMQQHRLEYRGEYISKINTRKLIQPMFDRNNEGDTKLQEMEREN